MDRYVFRKGSTGNSTSIELASSTDEVRSLEPFDTNELFENSDSQFNDSRAASNISEKGMLYNVVGQVYISLDLFF